MFNVKLYLNCGQVNNTCTVDAAVKVKQLEKGETTVTSSNNN